ncbi:RNA 2'-phosphotransferase [Erysipelotrichaceae bacterium RD49]|nr:RNA 2'-phosphotransferase [Erysipelotrichaceae bacterium RD49]
MRACQGHSIEVDAGQQRKMAPDILYHGSAQNYAASIAKQGLLPMSRQFVHLSADLITAQKVGSRHGKPIVFLTDSQN